MSKKITYSSEKNNIYTLERYLSDSKYKVLLARDNRGKRVVIKALNYLISDPDSLEFLMKGGLFGNQNKEPTTLQSIVTSDSITLNYDENFTSSGIRCTTIGLEQEFDFLSKLDHPGIVKPVEKGIDYIVIEHHYGRAFRFKPGFNPDSSFFRAKTGDELTQATINMMFHDQSIFSSKNFIDYLIKFSYLCSAIDHMHRRGIIHRDLKPSNVVETRSKVVLVDFDIARNYEVPVPDDGVIQGTLFYLAPEEITKIQYDPRTDIYSLGLMLYFSLVENPRLKKINDARYVFDLKTSTKFWSAKAENRYVPERLDRIVRKATALEMDDRYSSALEMRNDIRNYLMGNL